MNTTDEYTELCQEFVRQQQLSFTVKKIVDCEHSRWPTEQNVRQLVDENKQRFNELHKKRGALAAAVREMDGKLANIPDEASIMAKFKSAQKNLQILKTFEDAKLKYEKLLTERNLPIPDVSIIQAITEMDAELQHIADKANEFETATQVKLQQDHMCIERTKHETMLAVEELRKITLVPDGNNVPKKFTVGGDDNLHSFAGSLRRSLGVSSWRVDGKQTKDGNTTTDLHVYFEAIIVGGQTQRPLEARLTVDTTLCLHGAGTVQMIKLINCIDDTLHTFAVTLVDRPVDQAVQMIHERYTKTLPLAAELHALRQTHAIDWMPIDRLLVYLMPNGCTVRIHVHDDYPTERRLRVVSVTGEHNVKADKYQPIDDTYTSLHEFITEFVSLFNRAHKKNKLDKSY